MRKTIYIIILFFYFGPISALETKIIYKIENEIITNIDIKNEFKYLLALNNQLKELDKEKVFNIARESIIREKIKKIEVSKNFVTLEIDKKYTATILKNIYTRLDFKSLEEFIEYLKQYNLNLADVKKKLIIDALWNELIIAKYSSKIEINEQKLRDKIIKSGNDETKEYNLSEIIYEVNDTKNIQKKYEEIKKSVTEIGFKNSSSIYSTSETSKIGGNIGWVNASSLNNKIRDNILSLNINDLSSPFIMPGGVLILKIDDIKEEPKKINFDLELEKAKRYERNKQLNQYSQIYFNKTKKNLAFNE